jgi:VWFA-related protein
MRRFGFALIVAIVLASAVFAQLKVDVSLVNVVATVTDDKGLYVPDLTAEDFVVQEDGQPQTISHLTQSDDMPVSMGITLDTSGSMERKIATATGAVERFIRTIHPDDDIFLMTFSERPILRQDFTADRDKLAAALRKVTVGGGTALYDALDDSLRKVKKGQHDKKAVLLITDGVDTASYTKLEEAQLSVREAELLVYCIGIAPANMGTMTERNPTPPNNGGGYPGGGRRGGGYPGGGYPGGVGFPIPGIPGGIPFPIPGRRPYPFQVSQRRNGGPMNPDSVDMDVLNSFADASGGKAWLLSGTWTEGRGNQVETILDEIASELRNQYSIGYYPTHPLQDGKWHRIEITTKNRKYHVRARKEYFGK